MYNKGQKNNKQTSLYTDHYGFQPATVDYYNRLGLTVNY